MIESEVERKEYLRHGTIAGQGKPNTQEAVDNNVATRQQANWTDEVYEKNKQEWYELKDIGAKGANEELIEETETKLKDNKLSQRDKAYWEARLSILKRRRNFKGWDKETTKQAEDDESSDDGSMPPLMKRNEDEEASS